jgi:pentatricopeptide repeat protein
MQEQNVDPDERTFVMVLQACRALAEMEGQGEGKGELSALFIGESLHGDIRKRGLDSDPYIACALICLYGKCWDISKAENVFVGFPMSNVMLWNAILLAYLEQGEAVKTLQLYAEMNKRDILSDKGTCLIALQAVCAMAEKEKAQLTQSRFTKTTSLSIGKKLHASVKERRLDLDVFVANTILTMYGKCRSISDAETVFSGLSSPDTVSWNAMLSAYIEQGQGEKALHLFQEMQEKGVVLDEITLGCLLQACSLTGKKDVCRQIHFIIVSSGKDTSIMLSTTLIHAYGTCALTADAESIFSRLSSPDVIAWSALIASYAREGKAAASLQAFEKMLEYNIKPTGLTFLSVLLACSHGGFVEKGLRFFESMRKEYCIRPELEHYVGMVELLGRAGDFERLETLISEIPLQSDPSFWIGLLNACQRHGNMKLSKLILEKAEYVRAAHPAAYALMSNMCIQEEAGLLIGDQ